MDEKKLPPELKILDGITNWCLRAERQTMPRARLHGGFVLTVGRWGEHQKALESVSKPPDTSMLPPLMLIPQFS